MFFGLTGLWQKKVRKSLFNTFFLHAERFAVLEFFFVFGGVELFRLGLLVHSCCNPQKEEDRRGEGSWGSDQVLWKPSGVVVQVA